MEFIHFGAKVHKVVPFGKYSDRPDLKRIIRKVTYVGGFTQASEALDLARKSIAEREKLRPAKVAPKLLLFVTSRDIKEDDSAREQLTLMALKDIKILIVAMISTPMEEPAVSYGQIRHLIVNNNQRPKATSKWVLGILEKGALISIIHSITYLLSETFI